MKEMNTTNKTRRSACIQAVGSTIATACIVLLVNVGFNWIWVLTHDPEPGQSMKGYFMHCIVMTSMMVGSQLLVLLAYAVVIAVSKHIDVPRDESALGIIF